MKFVFCSTIAAITLCLLIVLPAMADESEAAHMVQEKCTACHDSGMYTRENRRVKTIAALGTQVRMCNTNTNAQWFDDEVDQVIDYLNSSYYKFGK